MKTIFRTASFVFAISLAACGGSDDAPSTPAAGAGGTSAAGSGGTSAAGAGGTSTGGSSGTSAAGTGGTSPGGSGGKSMGGSGGTSVGGSGGASGAGTGGTSAAGSGGTSMSGTISAAKGGTVMADGLLIEIPPGALMVDTAITVAVSDGASLPGAAGLISKAYDIGPNGTMFSKPVKLTIDYDVAKLGTKNPVVSYVEAGKWIALSDSVGSGGKVVATTTHFTPFGVLSADAAACVAMIKADCQTCCKTTFAKGEGQPIAFAIKFCGCTPGGPCETQCASNICTGAPPAPDCQTCLQTAGAGGLKTPCIAQASAACMADPDCSNYTTCSSACQ